MTTKKSYSRYFIILQEEEKGYSLASDKLPSGYAKFEMKNDKCRVTYYVQNLKKQTGPYHMVLICNKKDIKKIIKVGELNIDEHGRTEIVYEYSNNDIAGSGIGAEKIVGAAIVKFADTNIIPVMVGFTTTETHEDWKQYAVFLKREDEPARETPLKKSEPVLERKHKDAEKKVDAVVAQPVVKQEEPITERLIPQEKSTFDSYEENIESIKEVTEREVEESNRKKHSHKGAMGDYFKMVANGLEEVDGACQEIKRCKWYKVHIKDKKDLCDVSDYNKYSVIYYPMYSYFQYIIKYKHILLGYKYDTGGIMKYIVFAIPGKRCIAEQPYEGKSGFVTWVPLKVGDEEEESLGYWLMFYDFRNRTIAIATKV